MAWYKHEGSGEFETVMQTRDEVEGLHKQNKTQNSLHGTD